MLLNTNDEIHCRPIPSSILMARRDFLSTYMYCIQNNNTKCYWIPWAWPWEKIYDKSLKKQEVHTGLHYSDKHDLHILANQRISYIQGPHQTTLALRRICKESHSSVSSIDYFCNVIKCNAFLSPATSICIVRMQVTVLLEKASHICPTYWSKN